MQRIEDLECNKCHGLYSNVSRRRMSVLVDNAFLSICPKCTEEVAALMGFTPEKITEELAGMTRAKTENNRLKDIEDGVVCYTCHKGFSTRYGGIRVREGVASNALSWHLECYTETNGKEEKAKGEDAKK